MMSFGDGFLNDFLLLNVLLKNFDSVIFLDGFSILRIFGVNLANNYLIDSLLTIYGRWNWFSFFLDSSTHRYFRPRSSELDEVLLRNPFDRPHAVFVLEINGIEDKGPGLGIDSDVFVSSLKSRVALGQKYADIQLSDEDKVSLVSLNEPQPSDMEFTDNILDDFASWLGGSYVRNLVKPLTGELTFPLANDGILKLHMSKDADREFTMSLISLIRNVERVMQMHQDFSGSTHGPAELVMGRFDGVKVLKEQYGTNDLVQQGVELLVTSLSKIYDLLQKVYKGQIVGVVLFNGSPAKESRTMLTVTFTSKPGRYWLEERNSSPHDRMIAEVALVRQTLAWITRSILIMAALLAIYSLINMILSRDTLLHSNVKLH